LCSVDDRRPNLAVQRKDIVQFYDFNSKSFIGEIMAEDMMVHKGVVYTMIDGQITSNVCSEVMGKTIHLAEDVGSVFAPASKMFPGVVVQDILGKCWLSIFEDGVLLDIYFEEANGHRILDAKYDGGYCVLIAERKGQYFRFHMTISTTGDILDGSIEKHHSSPNESANFYCLANGMFIKPMDGDSIGIKLKNVKKVLTDCPLPDGAILHSEVNDVMFAEGNTLYRMSTK